MVVCLRCCCVVGSVAWLLNCCSRNLIDRLIGCLLAELGWFGWFVGCCLLAWFDWLFGCLVGWLQQLVSCMLFTGIQLPYRLCAGYCWCTVLCACLLCAGAEYQCYTADITRTFPANGRFSTQQRDIYDTVLHMQTHALQIMKAGQTLKEIDQACRVIMLQRLQELGLVKGSVDALLANKIDRVFMPHGLGHFLGLDVHDVGTGDGPVPAQLQPGHVVTCEPGVYFMPLLMDRARANSSQVCTTDTAVHSHDANMTLG